MNGESIRARGSRIVAEADSILQLLGCKRYSNLVERETLMDTPCELSSCAVVAVRCGPRELLHEQGSNLTATSVGLVLESYRLIWILSTAFSGKISKYFKILPGAVLGGTGLQGLTPDLLLLPLNLPCDSCL